MNDTIVLCYHAVSPTWEADLSVTAEAFERQLRYLLDRGYRGRTLADAVLDPVRGRTLVVTFDDGFRSVLERAYPILRELGLPATLFVVTSWVGRPEPMTWPGIDQWLGTAEELELHAVAWDELRSLQADGWEIGSHTVSHPHLSRLGDGELTAELRESRARCEDELGTPCRSIAYPYGDHDARVVAAAGAAGYAVATTLPDRFHRASPLRWPRVGVYHGDTEAVFRTKASPYARRLRRSPVWPLVAGVRRALRG